MVNKVMDDPMISTMANNPKSKSCNWMSPREARQVRMKENERKSLKNYDEEVERLAREKALELERQRHDHIQSMKERYMRRSLEKSRAKAQAEAEAAAAAAAAAARYSYATLKKKLQKAEQMQQEILDASGETEGRNRKSYKKLEQKRQEYLEKLDDFDEWHEEQNAFKAQPEEEEEDDASDDKNASVLGEDAKCDESIESASSDQDTEEHEKSLERQRKNQLEIDRLTEELAKKTQERIVAEEAADQAEAMNKALGDSSEFDWDDDEDDDGNEGKQSPEANEDEEPPQVSDTDNAVSSPATEPSDSSSRQQPNDCAYSEAPDIHENQERLHRTQVLTN